VVLIGLRPYCNRGRTDVMCGGSPLFLYSYRFNSFVFFVYDVGENTQERSRFLNSRSPLCFVSGFGLSICLFASGRLHRRGDVILTLVLPSLNRITFSFCCFCCGFTCRGDYKERRKKDTLVLPPMNRKCS